LPAQLSRITTILRSRKVWSRPQCGSHVSHLTRSTAVFQKPTVTRLVNKFPAFCETCGFVAVSTTAWGWTLYGSYSHTIFLQKPF
jgi:hypothetical protein